MIPHLGHGCIIGLETQNPPTISQYQVTISSFVGCTCPAFKKMMTKFRSSEDNDDVFPNKKCFVNYARLPHVTSSLGRK
jgi:hypothetical protein